MLFLNCMIINDDIWKCKGKLEDNLISCLCILCQIAEAKGTLTFFDHFERDCRNTLKPSFGDFTLLDLTILKFKQFTKYADKIFMEGKYIVFSSSISWGSGVKASFPFLFIRINM